MEGFGDMVCDFEISEKDSDPEMRGPGECIPVYEEGEKVERESFVGRWNGSHEEDGK